MLKSLASAAVLSLAAISSAMAQDLPRSPSEVPQAFERHFNAGDLDALAKLYGEGSVFVPTPGVSLAQSAEIRNALTQFMASKVPIKLTIRQVYQAGDTAQIVFDWVMQGKAQDGKPVDMAGTGADVVTRRADGTWVYAIDNPFGVAQSAR
ncbi:YybH family protein [Pseudomonas aeruginosa]|uniref:YybH family protein n=1 Tax=Pseudomonas aeruginosa TaxID=287 RepID=UPI001C13183A|nr:nuclear transport factor 2 family protein [Pseudomonas aeruginosa]